MTKGFEEAALAVLRQALGLQRSSAMASWKPSRPSLNCAAAFWWCNAPAGARAPFTSSPLDCCGIGVRHHHHRLAAPGAHARPDRSGLRLHLNAVTINSSNTEDWEHIEQDLLRGAVDLLLVSPERFNNADFRTGFSGRSVAARALS